MYKAVIFDLDGTLLDTLEDLANACNYALVKCELPTHQVEAYRRFVGDGRYKLIERILPENSKTSETFNKVLGLYDEYYEIHMMDMTKPYEGVIALLDSLKEKGLRLAVVSNKPHEFTTKVVETFFEDRIELVFGQRVNFPTKPNPATVFEVLKNFNVMLEECIYIGDSNVDIMTAKNAGIKSIGVAWGFRGKEELEAEGASFIASTVKELENLILNF